MAKAELHLGLHGPSAPKEISPFFPFCCCIIIVILLCPRPRDESFPTDPHLDIKVLNSVKKKRVAYTNTTSLFQPFMDCSLLLRPVQPQFNTLVHLFIGTGPE